RAPLVEEILTVKEQLDPKFAYLTEAPVADDKGNKTVIRFRRKTGEHYVRTEVDGKPTGWTAEYNDGKWAVASKAKTPAKRKAAPKKNAVAKKAPANKKAPAKNSRSYVAPRGAPSFLRKTMDERRTRESG